MFNKSYVKYQVYLIILFPLILSTCADPNARSSNPFPFLITYNLEDGIAQKPDSIFLSEVCSSLKYVSLQTTDSILIGQINKVAVDDSLIFIFEKDERILLFGNMMV